MTSKFIALPLVSGESFLLMTPDHQGKERVILVDAGTKSANLAHVLRGVDPSVTHIDIVVCTHRDNDHAGGFPNFVEDWYDMGRTIGEFWLPGRWAAVMPKILTDPEEIVFDLAAGAIDAIERLNEGRSRYEGISFEQRLRSLGKSVLDQVGDKLPPVEQRSEGGLEGCFGLNPEELEALANEQQETDDTVSPLETAGDAYELPFWWDAYFREGRRFNRKAWSEYLQAIETAKVIREIALAAINRHIRVRWFDFGKFERVGHPSGGEPGLLEPVCSVEVRPAPVGVSGIAVFLALRLTRQNVESLVFYRPETEQEPGVMFIADSRLAFGIDRPGPSFSLPKPAPARPLLVTAPHHGSDKNDHAYGVLEKWLSHRRDSLFVRNGGSGNQKLGEFCNQEERRCAQCVQHYGKPWSQTVEVHTLGNVWCWLSSAGKCP